MIYSAVPMKTHTWKHTDSPSSTPAHTDTHAYTIPSFERCHSTHMHTWSVLTFINCIEKIWTHTHDDNHTCTLEIHSYNKQNRASLLSLSVAWVTVQILPVIREQSLTQPPSPSIPAFEVRGNVRPNAHQGVLSPSLSLFSLWTVRQRRLPVGCSPVRRSLTQHLKKYPNEPSP